MKTCVYLLSYLAQFFLEWEIFQTEVVEKIKTHILYPTTLSFFLKSCRLWDNVEKYGSAGHATDVYIIWHDPFACWIIKATKTHLESVIFIACPRQQCLANVPICYVIHTLPLLFSLCGKVVVCVSFRKHLSNCVIWKYNCSGIFACVVLVVLDESKGLNNWGGDFLTQNMKTLLSFESSGTTRPSDSVTSQNAWSSTPNSPIRHMTCTGASFTVMPPHKAW